MNLRHNSFTLRSQLRIARVGLRSDSGTESVMVIDQQLQTREHHRREARTLESRLLSDQHLDIVRDRDTDSVNYFVKDPSGVGLVELRSEVGINKALAVGNVDGAYCCEDL